MAIAANALIYYSSLCIYTLRTLPIKQKKKLKTCCGCQVERLLFAPISAGLKLSGEMITFLKMMALIRKYLC